MTAKTIAQNVENVLRSRDISKLRKESYKFITLRMGFIAHYDLYGFQSVYRDTQELAKRLQTSEYSNDTNYNTHWASELDRRGEADTAATVKALVDIARKYRAELALEY